MGTFTELFIRFTTRKEYIPMDKVYMDCLRYFLFTQNFDIPKVLPDHPLFTLEKWYHIGHMNSYYTHPITTRISDFDEVNQLYNFTLHCSIKGEEVDTIEIINNFLDFLSPLMDYYTFGISFIGYYKPEGDTIHLLYVYKDSEGKVKYKIKKE